MRPKKHLEYYSRVYPDAWRLVDSFRADRGRELPWWPEWCFVPLSGTYAIVTAEMLRQFGTDEFDPSNMALTNDIGILGALAAWRVTQGVYRFDPDVYDAVINTPLTGNLPHDILFGMPEWCVYIETPGYIMFDRELYGFFAYLEYDVGNSHKELRLVLDLTPPKTNEECDIGLLSAVLHLGPWSLQRSIELVAAESAKQAQSLEGLSSTAPPELIGYLMSSYDPLISLLLYICSVNSKIGDGDGRPEKPRPKKTKKGIRTFPAPQTSIWDVGVRMGAVIRRERAQVREDIPASSTRQRSSPRQHIRRAHWHGFWSGPRDGEQKFTLRWMPPLLVRGEDSEKLPVTIKPVR